MAPPQSSSFMPKCFRYHAASAAWSPVLLKKTPPIPVIFAINAFLCRYLRCYARPAANQDFESPLTMRLTSNGMSGAMRSHTLKATLQLY
jgi:hypothetical protein